MAASRIRTNPTIRSEWNVVRILSKRVIRRKARKALRERVRRLRPPRKIRLVAALTRRPMRTTRSTRFQILRRYAFGVKMNPSAMTLIVNSTKRTSANETSAIVNHASLTGPFWLK